MSTEAAPAATAIPVDFRTLVGLREGTDPAEWGRIRASQLQAGRELALFLLGANLIATGVTASLFAGRLPLWLLAGWGAATTLVAVTVAVRRLRAHHEDGGYAPLCELRDTALEGLALAVVWSVPPILFAEPGTTPAYGLWMVLSVLMTAGAVAMAPLALSTLAFVGGVGMTAAVTVGLSGAYAASGATLLFTALLMLDCVTRARALVVIRAGQLALAERDETVSLLLREFEEAGADWELPSLRSPRVYRDPPPPRAPHDAQLHPGGGTHPQHLERSLRLGRWARHFSPRLRT